MNKAIAKKWLKQSKRDLEMAEKNIGISGFDIAAFLLHQAVEKLFKAILALESEHVPKIHYLDELGNLLGLSEEMMSYVIDLTADYMFSKYPDVSDNVPFELYDEKIAREKLSFAKLIFADLENKIRIIEED